MKRTAFTLTLALFFSFIGLAWSQVPAQRVIIVDPTGMHAASVTGGNLGTAGSASVTVDTISHITSAVHVAGIAQTVAVNCVTGCTGSSHLAVTQAGQWNVAHIGSVVHVSVVGGSVSSSGGDAVNVFHQSTIRHISSTTHVFLVGMSREAHMAVAQSGTWNVAAHIQGGSGHVAVTFAGGGHVAITQGAAALQVDCSNCSAAAVVGVTHISAAVHLAGTINGASLHIQGLGIPGQAHGGVLTIQGIAGGVSVPVSGTVAATQSGAFNVSAAQSGAWTISAHVLSLAGHVAITQGAAALQVDCSNCSAAAVVAVTHISSAVHLAGTINGAQLHIQGLGIPGQAHGGVLTVQGVAGGVALPVSGTVTANAAQSGAWNVSAAQSGAFVVTAAHIVGGSGHIAITQGAAALQVDCSNCSAAAVVNVGHIAGAVHIGGTINGAQLHIQGLGIPGQAHGGVLTVQGIAGGVNLPISGAVTITSGTVAATQSGAFNVSAAQSGAWTVSAHILSTTGHIAVTMADHFVVRVPGHVAVTQASGRDTLAHITSVTHVVGIGNGGALHVVGLSNVGSGTASSGTTAMACHTTVAFSTTADLVLAHSQNAWRIYICAIVLVNAAAESVSIVEGTGTTCGTTTRGIIGGFGGTMSLAANGGFSAISPFPVFSSSANGNNVCLDKSGSGNVSGSISYRAAP